MSKDCKECANCIQKEEIKQFEVTIALTEKYWNEELKKYIFVFDRNEAVIVSDTPEVTVITTELWRAQILIHDGDANKIIIRRA
jgi:hypothetical protein